MPSTGPSLPSPGAEADEPNTEMRELRAPSTGRDHAGSGKSSYTHNSSGPVGAPPVTTPADQYPTDFSNSPYLDDALPLERSLVEPSFHKALCDEPLPDDWDDGVAAPGKSTVWVRMR